MKPIAIVIGAGGGIGAALARRLAADARYGAVVGLGRRSDPPLDLLDEGSIASALAAASERGPLGLVLVASGVLHDGAMQPEKSWRQIDPAAMARAFAVNATGPALVMKHALPLFPRDARGVFAALSARVGSIGDNRAGGWHAYRASKAALNQLVRTAAIELARTRPQALCVALHPGTVDTPLSAPFAKAGLSVRSPDEAAADLLRVIERLTPADSGGFFDQSGARVPW